jgi:hypothetical protein
MNSSQATKEKSARLGASQGSKRISEIRFWQPIHRRTSDNEPTN